MNGHVENQADADSFKLCESCYLKGNYPTDLKQSDFESQSLSSVQWERIKRDFTHEVEQTATSKPSLLSSETQQQLLSLVMKHGDDWKRIGMELGFKNKKEVILEFLRAPIEDLKGEDSSYLYQFTESKSLLQNQMPSKDLRDLEPYNQADQLFLQCELLQQFARDED